MDSYAQYHAQQPSAYPHAHQQHPNQPSPVLQTQQQPNYAQQQQQMAHPQMMAGMPYGNAYALQTQYVPQQQQSHAAVMATAAASGYPPPSYPMGDQAGMAPLPQTSPRMGQVKTDNANMQRSTDQSPRTGQMGAPGTLPPQMTLPSAQAMPANMGQMQTQSLPARRMSHVSSPAVQHPQHGQGGMNAPPRPAGPPQGGPPQVAEAPVAGQVEESPLYVNAKQFHRILKRRMARQKLEETLRLTNKGRKPYLHESRHNHAMRRPRGPGGRFLTAEEVSAMEARGEMGDVNGNGTAPATNGTTKRKRNAGGNAKGESQTKKVKSDEEDDEDDDDQDDDG